MQQPASQLSGTETRSSGLSDKVMQFMPATVVLFVAVGFLACDRGAVVEPEPGDAGIEDTSLEPGGAFLVNCEANVETEAIRCAPEDSEIDSEPGLETAVDLDGGLAVRVVIGGQGQYVQLTSSGVCSECTTANIFQADVTIQNLLPQRLGNAGGNTFSPIYVPFHEGPTNGVIVNPSGPGVFATENGYTRPGFQVVISYPPDSMKVDNNSPWLESGETSKAFRWEFDISGIGSNTTFTFSVFVYADVPYPDGYIEVTPDTGTVKVGQSTQFTAVARDLVGREVTGRTFTWTSLDPSAVSIDNTGLASASVNRAALIVAESDGPETPDTVTAWAFEDLADRVRTTTPYDPDGPRNFRFVISSGGAWQAGEAGASSARALRLPDWPADRTVAGTGRSGFDLYDIEGTSSVVGFATDSIDTTTWPGSSGADLRVRYGKPPDLSRFYLDEDYDEPFCNSYFSANVGLCEFSDPADGNWYVTVDQGSNFTEIDVIADYAQDDPGYDIELVYTDDALSFLSSAQMDSLRSLADRLEAIVTSNLSPATAWYYNVCFSDRGSEYFATDDLVILVDTFTGSSGGTLGSGGYCGTRSSNNLPVLGALSLDEVDFAGTLGDPKGFNDVALHELIHVLGLGPLWEDFSLVTGIGSDPVYVGAGGIQGYENVGGPPNTDVPVEDMGGSGTANAHWRETVFETELMTGIYNGTGVANPLSEMSIRSLEDLGYTVDVSQADPYTLPGTSVVLDPSLSEPIPFGDDLWKGPVYQTTPDGVIRRIR